MAESSKWLMHVGFYSHSLRFSAHKQPQMNQRYRVSFPLSALAHVLAIRRAATLRSLPNMATGTVAARLAGSWFIS